MQSIINRPKIGTQLQKVTEIFTVNATESSVLTISGKVLVVNGVNGVNPILVKVYHDFGDGWDELEAKEPVSITESGKFVWHKRPTNYMTGPKIKVELSVESPAEFSVLTLRYASFDECDSISFPGGEIVVDDINANVSFERNGVDTKVAEDTVNVGNSRPMPVKILDSIGNGVSEFGSVNTVSKLPKGANAITFQYPSDIVEVVEYRSGGVGGAIVQSQTITYTDSSKERIASILIS